MKLLCSVLAVLFLSIPAAAQSRATNTQGAQPASLPEWFRVFTFEDSTIELNTNYVMFSNYNTERVRFRWSFQTPQPLRADSSVKYQSVLQEFQFYCRNKVFRLYAAQWYDAAGKIVASENRPDSEEMQEVEFGSMMGKLYPQACKLIALRKREPAVEQ